MSEWIPNNEWKTIVSNVPIVSVDLLVQYKNGILLGKRVNEPAKGHWFMPGGRVQKGETRSEAVHRIAEEELGLKVQIVESLGTFEHFYQKSDVDEIKTKHYLANGFVVDVLDGDPQPDDQHSDLRVFHSIPTPQHEYLREYFANSDTLTDWL